MNFVSSNGYYGCSFCLSQGVYLNAHHVLVHPFQKCPVLRNNITDHVAEAIETRQPSFGVKGSTILSQIDLPTGKYDSVEQTGVDYMHLMGIIKRLLSLWFDSKYSRQPWYLGAYVKEIDENISNLRLPTLITRKPRSIAQHRKYFKAIELRNFLLYWGPVVLKPYLPEIYYAHFLLLANAFMIGLQLKIEEIEVKNVHENFTLFYFLFGKIYGPQYLSMNFHLLCHLADHIRRFGPFWTLSSFPYESMNGSLLALISGTDNLESEAIFGPTWI
eukprot:Pompholyxophrys_punicea_v1_NODE_878_length_1176_cov_22.534344.p1 type:complete len:274 gc:universal NODE_878_length_1176_cov_22.534344:837-16(-)